MKAVILAGGFGTRISEETDHVPKPMVEIGDKPILWHIMKLYSAHGINDFIICLGYKGYIVKEYFSNYFLHTSDVTFDMKNNKMTVHQKHAEPWKVTLVSTGLDTMTGGRLLNIKDYLGDSTFCLTYGDGLGDVDITSLIKFHRSHKKLATVTAVKPLGRFGSLSIDGSTIIDFSEKVEGERSWINGGYFVLEPKVIDYINSEKTILERDPMMKLSKLRQLQAFIHEGFWQPMDTLREKRILEKMWSEGQAPWKVWE